MMKILFWNIRGLGASGRRNQLRELRKVHGVDAICLQETIKSDFSPWDLQSLSDGESFEWVWTAASGHSGGTLTGVKIASATVVAKDRGVFFSSLGLISSEDNFQWEMINVYGPVQNDRRLEFLQELSQKLLNTSCPIMLGGDFNLIRYAWEKSSGNINQFWLDSFNGFIMDNGLLEINRIGSKYTWTNKQANPIMCVLDRVLICNGFNSHYGRATCETVTRVGSDHNPLVVNTADHRFRQQRNFRFEMYWMEQQGFKETILSKWPVRGGYPIQDFWRDLKSATRKFCRGWGANNQSQFKKDKRVLLEKLREFDRVADSGEVTTTQWQIRYTLEAELERIYNIEELHLKRQGGIKWILKGDANNSFFHGIASGRRRRSAIFYLEDNGVEIRDLDHIRKHVDLFYKELFCAEAGGEIMLGDNFWGADCTLSQDEADELIKPFTLKEIETALKNDGL
jgi:exonuclease III